MPSGPRPVPVVHVLNPIRSWEANRSRGDGTWVNGSLAILSSDRSEGVSTTSVVA